MNSFRNTYTNSQLFSSNYRSTLRKDLNGNLEYQKSFLSYFKPANVPKLNQRNCFEMIRVIGV